MLKNLYYWFYKKVVKKTEERDAPSGGWWPDMVRQKVASLCQNRQGKLLEIGCGEGLFLARLESLNRQLELHGIDNNISKLRGAGGKCKEKRLKNIKLIYGDAVSLPFKDESFDAVICINTFLNMSSIDAVTQSLIQMVRVCKKEKEIIFDFRNSLNPLVNLKYRLAPFYDLSVKEDKLPLNAYNPKCIEKILRKLNLAIVNRICIGFPLDGLASIVIIEAKKC